MSRNPMLAIGVAAALALGATPALAQGTNSDSTSRPSGAAPSMNGNSESAGAMHKPGRAEQHFLTEAMQGDMAEVQMGKLAQQKGQSEDVKQFGEMLQQDHGQHLQQAEQMAQQMGVTPPQGPNAKEKAAYERMNKLSGAQFDKQFARMSVRNHKKDIAEYQKQAKSKGPLAQFAQQTIPTLQKHLQTAQAIENKGAMTGSKAGRR